MTGLISVLLAAAFAAPFGDHMVLQRDRPVRVWGTAKAGETVKVSFGGRSVETTADASGAWRTELPAMPASAEGRELVANDARLKDVLVGEVWLAGGQSNMNCPLWSDLARYHDESGLLVSHLTRLPLLRFATAPGTASETPLAAYPRAATLKWMPAVPANLTTVSFSAVAFYFARELQLALGIPVGIVNASRGGTNIDAWIPQCGLDAVPELADLAHWEFKPREYWQALKVKKLPIDGFQQQPTALWNGFLAPLAPMATRGFIWYQGERNCVAGEAGARYEAKLRALHGGWADEFANPELRLYVVQLCSWGHDITAFQETQRRFCEAEPNAHLAVINDLGDPNDIHPPRKEPVGRRLAALALKYEYGFSDLPAEAPVLRSATADGEQVTLAFSDVRKLSLRNAERTTCCGIELAGADGKFRPATILNFRKSDSPRHDPGFGSIEGTNLVVKAEGVSAPSRVRYLARPPHLGVIFNEVGLPVASFDAPVAARPRGWRPKERWRGFNLEGYGLKGSFAGKIEETDMKWIRELGFNFVRVMVDYHFICRDDDWTKPDPAKCGFIDEALTMSRRHRLHMNLCLSIPPGVDYKVTRSKEVLFADAKAQGALVDYWRFLAKRYRGVPNEELTFNLFNEPNTDPKGDRYVRLIDRCLRAIADEDPERFVIADGLESGRKPEFGATVFPNLAQSLHAYVPMCVSHYRAPWCQGYMGEPVWPPMPVVSPICGSRKPAEARGPIAIRNFPACTLTVVPRLVNRAGEIYVKLDGRELYRKLFVPKPGAGWTNLVARTNGEWAGAPLEPIEVAVPSGGRLEVGLGAGDWVEIASLKVVAGDRRTEILPEFDFARSQSPRQDLWFRGFDGAPVACDAKGTQLTGAGYLHNYTFSNWDKVLATGQMVMVGEFGFFNRTPHEIGLRWLEDNLKEWKKRGLGWALWNFRGAFGILDSERPDAEYVDFHGHKLDQKMLDLLRRY